MAITTKQTLSNKKFRQSTHDELNLNGKVIIGGELSLNDGNHGVGKIITSDANGKFIWSETGIPNGVATLDENGLVPSSQLPSYVDDVLEFDNFTSLPTTGETGKIYVTKDTNSTYRWSGSQYIKVNDAVSTSETATKLATPRNIQATGDATWQVTFDGSKNVTAALTLANTGVTPNSYGNNITIPALTIDSKGRITSISTNTVRSATQSVSGVMSAADKTKLDGIATGANNYTHPNHTGDVTSSGDGATVISNDVVSNAKLANMGASTIKGRLNSSGDPQDLTAAQVRSLLNIQDGAEVNVQSDWNQTSTNADDYIKNKPSIPNSIDELGEINPNTIIGNDLSTANSPKQINISENQFLGRLTGENIKGVEAINMYGLSSGTKSLIEDNNNWDENGIYIGTTITDAKSGQKHYDLNYLYEFVTDNTPIRTIRYTVGLATKLATPRNIQATGDATWQVSFDGSQNVTAALTLANTGVVPNTYGNNITIPALTIDSKGRVTSISTNTVRSATQSVSGVMSAADKTKLDGIATGANNYTHPNHTGDVTSSGDGATVISNDVVSNAKLANMGANLIKGRITTTGDPQDLTAAQVRTLLNVADGANNYTHPNHTGDVTSNGDGATVIAANAVTSTKISNDAVTNSKLANMGANTIKGRLNSIGDPQDLTVTQVKTLLSLKSISEKDYWFGAQATYDAISTKDANTIYFIPEP